jgi:hypothetical protein
MLSHTARRLAAITTVVAAALALSSCAQSDLRLSPDYSVAVRQNLAAQIADPDAQYAGVPTPASNGTRTAASVTRYVTDKVIQPVSPTTSSTGGAAPTSSAPPTTTTTGPS